jgi:hypothetical protein
MAQVESDSLSDIFPLSIGNQWTYSYNSSLWDQLPDVFFYDTGTVSYLITDAIVTQDSTRWMFRKNLDVMHRYLSTGIEVPFADTSYLVRDTTTFELVELHQGNHQIYCPSLDS